MRLTQGDAGQLEKMYAAVGGSDLAYSKTASTGDQMADACVAKGKQVITTAAECKAAATALGLDASKFADSIDSPRGRPYGCIWNNGKRLGKGLALNLHPDAVAKGTQSDGTLEQVCKASVPKCKARNLNSAKRMTCTDLDAGVCGGLGATCKTAAEVAKCCACGGGVKSQCYDGGACKQYAILPMDPVLCIVDITKKFSPATQAAYGCIVQNGCTENIRIRCPSCSPDRYSWTFKGSGGATLGPRCLGTNARWKDMCTGGCTVEKLR